jgi:hypothetical protein
MFFTTSRLALAIVQLPLVLLATFVSTCLAADCTVYEDDNGGGWSRDVTGETVFSGRENDSVSSVRLEEGVIVFLYEHHDYGGVALVICAPGLHNLPEGWNDRITSVRTVRTDLSNPMKQLREISALAADPDKVYELKMTPFVQRAASRAAGFAQGNSSEASFEYCELDVKKGSIKLRLNIRHCHRPIRQVTLYDVSQSLDIEVSADSREWGCKLDLGRGVVVRLDDVL